MILQVRTLWELDAISYSGNFVTALQPRKGNARTISVIHHGELSYAELGQSEQAIAAADRAVKSTQNPVILSQAAAAYALAGRQG